MSLTLNNIPMQVQAGLSTCDEPSEFAECESCDTWVETGPCQSSCTAMPPWYAQREAREEKQAQIAEVFDGHRTLQCYPPLWCTLTRQEGMVLLDCEELDIYVAGHSVQEALQQLSENVFALWHECAQADDRELTLDAIHLKRRLLDRLRVV